jgi:hypothetical protein
MSVNDSKELKAEVDKNIQNWLCQNLEKHTNWSFDKKIIIFIRYSLKCSILKKTILLIVCFEYFKLYLSQI